MNSIEYTTLKIIKITCNKDEHDFSQNEKILKNVDNSNNNKKIPKSF